MRIIARVEATLALADPTESGTMAALPDYGKPPVVEVVMGVQFTPIVEFTAAHLGLYWAGIRDTFGRVEEQAPIAHVLELPPGESPSQPPFQVLDKPDLPRSWFIDATGNRVIQVQRDRFLHNWRKLNPTDEYPRFPLIKRSFLKHWAGFSKFLADQGFSLEPDQCELTYVNHVKKGDGWDSIKDLGGLFTTFAWRTRSGFLPTPDNVRWSLRFVLPQETGRLYVEAMIVRVQPQNEPAIRLSLTARGKPPGITDSASMVQWYELAREWIVKGFADLVDEKTDSLWERKA